MSSPPCQEGFAFGDSVLARYIEVGAIGTIAGAIGIVLFMIVIIVFALTVQLSRALQKGIYEQNLCGKEHLEAETSRYHVYQALGGPIVKLLQGVNKALAWITQCAVLLLWAYVILFALAPNTRRGIQGLSIPGWQRILRWVWIGVIVLGFGFLAVNGMVSLGRQELPKSVFRAKQEEIALRINGSTQNELYPKQESALAANARAITKNFFGYVYNKVSDPRTNIAMSALLFPVAIWLLSQTLPSDARDTMMRCFASKWVLLGFVGIYVVLLLSWLVSITVSKDLAINLGAIRQAYETQKDRLNKVLEGIPGYGRTGATVCTQVALNREVSCPDNTPVGTFLTSKERTCTFRNTEASSDGQVDFPLNEDVVVSCQENVPFIQDYLMTNAKRYYPSDRMLPSFDELKKHNPDGLYKFVLHQAGKEVFHYPFHPTSDGASYNGTDPVFKNARVEMAKLRYYDPGVREVRDFVKKGMFLFLVMMLLVLYVLFHIGFRRDPAMATRASVLVILALVSLIAVHSWVTGNIYK